MVANDYNMDSKKQELILNENRTQTLSHPPTTI